jgi:hypothetical protein
MPKATRKSSTSRDPIFALIANHNRLADIFYETARAQDEGRASACELTRAIDAEAKAARKMSKMKPNTVAGAAALLTYTLNGRTGLFYLDGETDWHQEALRSVTTALEKIAGRS